LIGGSAFVTATKLCGRRFGKPGYFLIRPIVVIRVLVVLHDPGGDPVAGDDEPFAKCSHPSFIIPTTYM